ncbi:MAG: VOC family protein, partial [Sediminibacterium sp.]
MKRFACIILLITAFGRLAAQSNMKPNAVLNHLAIYVVNLEKTVNFYSTVFQLDTIPEPFHDGRHTWFLIGPKSHLHIISGVKTPLPKEKNTHLCFTVPSVEEFIPRLTKNNVPFESWTGEKQTFTKRVDGVK